MICACFCGNISKEKTFDMHCANISSPECVICAIRCRVLPLAKHVDRRIVYISYSHRIISDLNLVPSTFPRPFYYCLLDPIFRVMCKFRRCP